MPLFEGENHREKLIVLLTMCFALAMAMLDNTVVNVALPTLSRELHATISHRKSDAAADARDRTPAPPDLSP